MSTYIELNIGIKLRANDKVINTLRYMLGETSDAPDLYSDDIYNDDFFRTAEWAYVLRTGSYYFDGQPDSRLYTDLFVDNPHEDNPTYFLNVRANSKNYHNEIEKFLSWLAPYCETRGFIGYIKSEILDYPCLLYATNDKIQLRSIKMNEQKEDSFEQEL